MISFNFAKCVICLTIFIMLVPNPPMVWPGETACADAMDRGFLNVLTINLLFSEISNREDRLAKLADFIAEHEDGGDPVDIVLLQEVVGGPLSGTINSSLDLQRLLAEQGITYNLRYRMVNGMPGVLVVGNAILSRCQIIFTIAKTLPFVSEEPWRDVTVSLRRKIMMSRIKIPGFGKINVYNTHLCAYCDPIDRSEQTWLILEFIDKLEDMVWGENPVILGGDFNADINIVNDIPVHELIVNSGFLDSYAAANDCGDCCSEENGYEGCTYAVHDNPFTNQPDPERIDYIFTRDLQIEDSVVVFNSDVDWVSDHSGVLTKIRLSP